MVKGAEPIASLYPSHYGGGSMKKPPSVKVVEEQLFIGMLLVNAS